VNRLIEDELPLAAINAESGRDKSLRHGHVCTLHLWWASRPLPMSRAIVYGSLVSSPADQADRRQMLDDLANAMPFERALGSQPLDRLRQRIREEWPHGKPKVLDCFAGRGIIPMEALRLGCDVHSVDLNPVAHLIQRAILEFPQRWNDVLPDGRYRLVTDYLRWASRVREIADKKVAPQFPIQTIDPPAVFFWARTMPCSEPHCRRIIPLIRTRKLADSPNKKIRVDYEVLDDRVDLQVREGIPTDGSDWSGGTMRASSVTCPACSTTQSANEVRKYAKDVGFGYKCYAVMTTDSSRTNNRAYRAPSSEELAAADVNEDLLSSLPESPDGTSAIPDEMMVKSQYRRFANLVYGIDSWKGLFTNRQVLVLASLSAAVRQVHGEMIEAGEDPERAAALCTYLAFIVDRVADYNSTFATWASSGEFVAHTFPQQSIRMAWDFTEIDPFADVSGSFNGAVHWIELVLQNLCGINAEPATVTRGNAQALDYPDGYFDAVITDPPYYDSFQYGDLSDFFYVWMKRSIGFLYPDLFSTPLTPKQAEVVETRADKKSPEYVSHEEFELRLGRAIRELARVVRDDGIVTIVFAHTDVDAWERLLRALRSAGLVVTTSWPMRSERSARPTAFISAVLSSSVALVCRKEASVGEGFYDDVVRQLEDRINERLSTFEEMQLQGADYFVSAIGPAFEVFAKYSRVIRLSGEEVGVDELMVLARQAVAKHAARKLLGGESITALDDRALMYLTWRWAYDGEAIPADEAYKLGRAFDLDFSEMAGSDGMIEKAGDKFTLLGPDERRSVAIEPGASLVDVLHAACQLHDAGRRDELASLLSASGASNEPGFWALASAIAQALPDGDRERTMLLGLTGNREAIEQAAKRAEPVADMPSLFGTRNPSLFGDEDPTLFDRSPS